MTSADTTAKPRRLSPKRAALFGAGILIVVATFAFFLPKIANYGDVWAVVKTLSWEWIAVLLGAVVLNIATFAPPWMVALPGPALLPGAHDDAGLDRALDASCRAGSRWESRARTGSCGAGISQAATSAAR